MTGGDAVAADLARHPAVADAAVVDGTAFLVPDPDHAPLLARAVAIEAAGRLGGLAWHEPADELLVAQLNRTETDFLYGELVAGGAYLRHGIALPEEAVVVDAGANIGMFTVLAATRSPGARVVAVEPVAELAAAVGVNADLHEVDAVVVPAALGAAPGETDLTYYPGNSVMSGRYADDEEDREVLRRYLVTGEGAVAGRHLDDLVAERMVGERRRCPVTTVQDVVAGAGLPSVDLLKVDVEKAEAEVLDGIDDATWDGIAQVAVEVHDLGGRLDDVGRLLERHGFEVARDRDERLTLTPCWTVYGRRPGDRRAPATPRPPAPWPTLRALARELRRLLAGRGGTGPVPERFVLVADAAVAAADARPRPAAGGARGPGAAALADVWGDVFGPAAVRDDADFFELGGDSLTAVRLLVALEARLGADVVAPDLVFTASRFGDLAAAVDAGVAGRPAG